MPLCGAIPWGHRALASLRGAPLILIAFSRHHIALSPYARRGTVMRKNRMFPFFNIPPVCLAIDFARMLSYQEVPTSICQRLRGNVAKRAR
jgi:hypothetical protein